MGKGVAEIAEMLSFPELFLILRRDAKRKAADFRLMALSQILAAAAPWSTEANEKANKFIRSLSEPEETDPEQNTNKLIQMFSGSGIPIREE
jgi:hypothetical protein